MSDQNGKLGTLDPEKLHEEFAAIRVESVMAKLPLHTLSTQGQMQVHIEKRNEDGELSLQWRVSPSTQFGEPRHLAYRLDTLIINKRIDEAGPPTPKVIRLGSLRSICRELGLTESGHNFSDIKQALSQNAGATIKAKLHYRDKEGRGRKLEAVFARYSVVFTGDTLPDGTEADGVFVVMNDIYQGFLNQVPFRPLDYNYLRQLPPSASRFYEIVSFRIYTALKYGWPKVSLAYSEYCEATGQRRLGSGTEVSKQMYKLHKPHMQSGYLAKVELEKITDGEGNPDWNLWYFPGPRAKDEYTRFSTDKNSAEVPVESGRHLLPRTLSPAEMLVMDFINARFGKTQRRIAAKEIEMAEAMIADHGVDQARKRLLDSLSVAIAAGTKPVWMTELQKFMQIEEKNPKKKGKGREGTN